MSIRMIYYRNPLGPHVLLAEHFLNIPTSMDSYTECLSARRVLIKS